MEAVPRLSMISCELKNSPNSTEFGLVLLKYIRDHYHEDPETYKKEVKELETLRQTAIKPPHDYTGCSILKRYYAQLHFLQSRFPMTDDGAACVAFTWADIYSQLVYSITDIEYEEACILYNIGALHSDLGASDPRANPEGMKLACTHFQCAAWAFQHLRDTYPQPKVSDMSHDVLTFFIDIMLAQAQECILEKSMLDSRKSSITAKVAAQVVEYYRRSIGILCSGSPNSDSGCVADVVGQKLVKEWKKFLDLKVVYYKSVAYLYMGNQAEEKQKMGERVTWYLGAYEALSEAIQLSKAIDRTELNEALAFTMDVVGGKYNNAKKENDFVYHERVPTLESLPDLQRACLVKGIPFNHTDPDVCGADIFARLVPMEAHELSSLYSEEKAKILRSVSFKVEDKDQELTTYLSSLQLDKDVSNLKDEPLPEELLRRCASMSVNPNAIPDLNDTIKEIVGTSVTVEANLTSCFELLDGENKRENIHQEKYGRRTPPLLLVEMTKEFSKYQGAHIQAIDTNNQLQDMLSCHIDLVKLLCKPLEEIENRLPSLSFLESPDHEKVSKEFQQLLDKVKEMQVQRGSLVQQLREALKKDDITEIIVTQTKKEDMQKTFQEELKKHDQLLMYLEQNLGAQDNILCALTQANAVYAETRKAAMEIRNERELMLNTLITSFDVYEDVKQQTENGLEFYRKLHASVNRLLLRLRSLIDVQNDERLQIAQAEAAKNDMSFEELKSSILDTPPPKLEDDHIKLGRAAKELCNRLCNYIPTLLSSPPDSESSSEPMDFSEPEANANHTAPLKYSSELPISGVSRPSVGSEAKTVSSEICPGAAPLVYSNAVEPLHSNQYWNSAVPAKGFNPGPAVFRFGPTLSKDASVPQNRKFSAAVARPSQPAVTIMGTSVTPYFVEPDYTALYSVGYSTVTVNSSQVYSSSLPSYTSSPSVPLTSNGNVPYSQVTRVPLFDGYRSIPVSTCATSLSSLSSYMTSGISDPASFRSGSPSTSSSHSPQKAFPEIYTDEKRLAYQTVDSVPEHETSSPAPYSSRSSSYSPLPSSSYSPLGSSSYNPLPGSPYVAVTTSSDQYRGLVSGPVATACVSHAFPPTHSTVRVTTYMTSASSYSYSVPSWSQMSPLSAYCQQFPSMTPLSSTYHSPVPHQAHSSHHHSPVPHQAHSSHHHSPVPHQAHSSHHHSPVPHQAHSSHHHHHSPVPHQAQSSQHHHSPVPHQAQISHHHHSHSMMPLSSTGYPFTFQPQPESNLQSPSMMSASQSTSYRQIIQQQPESSQPSHGVSPTFSISRPTPFQYEAESSQQSPGMMPLTTNSYLPSVQENQPESISPMIHPNMLTIGPDPRYRIAWIPSVQNLPYAPSTIAENGGVNPSCSTDTPLDFRLQNRDPLSYVSVPVVQQKVKIDPIIPKPVTELHVETKKDEKHHLSKDIFSSTDSDLLSETIPQQTEPKVLQPKVVDVADAKLASESKDRDKGTSSKDPIDDPVVQEKFIVEVEKYEKFVDGIVRKSLNGTTPLDQKWKEFTDAQDKQSRKMSISIARCYPMKNRFPDIMPYDNNRVRLTTMKDDYINASFLTDFFPSCPVFINTQAPLPATFADFWVMIWDQQVETLVCLMSTSEFKNQFYYPKEKGRSLQFGLLTITLQNQEEKLSSVEYRISLTHSKNRISRVVILLQFTAWPSSGVPSSPSQFLQFITEVLNYQKQQRSLLRPVAVHCRAGVGRSGVFCIVCAIVTELQLGHGPTDIVQIAARMSQQRKFLIQDKDQLKFCYDAVLYYAQDLLMKRGILTNRASFEDKLPGSGGSTSHSRHPSEDFILGSGGLAKLQSGIAKMGLSDQSSETPGYISPSKELEQLGDLSLTQENACPAEVKDVKPSTCVSSVVSEIISIPPKDVQSEKEVEPDVASDESNPPITDLLDPSHFTLETGSPVKRRITKESFLNPAGGLTNPTTDTADPLSQLDPLWSLKKSKS